MFLAKYVNIYIVAYRELLLDYGTVNSLSA
jgi:hypothetical protein